MLVMIFDNSRNGYLLVSIISCNISSKVEQKIYQKSITDKTSDTVSLGPHGAYFRMRKLKSQVVKMSTVRVEKTFALVVQHSQRKCESSLSSSPNWQVAIQRAQFLCFSATFQ